MREKVSPAFIIRKGERDREREREDEMKQGSREPEGGRGEHLSEPSLVNCRERERVRRRERERVRRRERERERERE